MAALNMFRKEALKQRYKSQEYGEAIVVAPEAINKAIWVILCAIALMTFVALITPISSTRYVAIRPHETNFKPIVFPHNAIVERHFVDDGQNVQRQQGVSRIRYFSGNDLQPQFQTLLSDEAGSYFPVAEPGEKVDALDPVGKLLKDTGSDYYIFWIDEAHPETLEKDQSVQVVTQNLSSNAVIVAVVASVAGKTKVILKLSHPYQKAILNPNLPMQLMLKHNSRNVFELIGGAL